MYYMNVPSITLCNYSSLGLNVLNLEIRNLFIHSEASSWLTLFPPAASFRIASSLGLTLLRASMGLPHNDTCHHLHCNSELHHLDHQSNVNQPTHAAAVTATHLPPAFVPTTSRPNLLYPILHFQIHRSRTDVDLTVKQHQVKPSRLHETNVSFHACLAVGRR